MSTREGSWGGVQALQDEADFASKPICIQKKKKKTKKQWDEDHKKISVARDVHESWKKIKCM